MDWLMGNLWVTWLAAAGILAVAETLTLDFTFLMLASGALAGVVVAAIFPGLLWLQLLVALIVAVGMLGLLRPTLLAKIRDAPGYRSSVDKMVGSVGLASSEITTTGGEIKVNGEVWTARTLDGVIPAGTQIEVYQIEGAVAVVYPRSLELP